MRSAPRIETGWTHPILKLLPNLQQHDPDVYPLLDNLTVAAWSASRRRPDPLLLVKFQFYVVGLNRFKPYHCLRSFSSRVSVLRIFEWCLGVFL